MLRSMPFLNPTYIIALLIAVSVHEWAHAITATKLGDPTPEEAGRLSLSPLTHIDPLGALLFLTVGFGWAKPVPINTAYFRNPKRDMLLTAAAGPFSNLVLAFLAFVGLQLLVSTRGAFSVWELLSIPSAGSVARVFLAQLCAASIFVNLGLMAFNLLPISPLDGSNVLQAFIPHRHSWRYEEFRRYGPFVLLGLFLAEGILNIPLLSLWITTIMEWVLGMMTLMFS